MIKLPKQRSGLHKILQYCRHALLCSMIELMKKSIVAISGSEYLNVFVQFIVFILLRREFSNTQLGYLVFANQ